MPSIYVDKVAGDDSHAGTQAAPKQTIQAGVNALASGDTCVVAPTGVYNESVNFGPTARTGMSLVSSVAGVKPVVDGGGTIDRGLWTNTNILGITIDGFEVRNFYNYGIMLNAGTLTAATNHVVKNCEVHHIGTTNKAVAGYDANQSGIMTANGVNNQILNNVVHHVGQGGEARGILTYWGDSHTIKGNTIYMVRKEGIRAEWGKNTTVESNLMFGCWTAITLEFWVGGFCINNAAWDCSIGIYTKQINDDTHAPNVRTTWGGGTPIPAAWVRIWHNTTWRCSLAHVATAPGSAAPSDMVDVRNNIWGSGPAAGASFLQDGPTWRGPNWIVDGNLYSTAGTPPVWCYLNAYQYADKTNNQATLAGLKTHIPGWEVNGLQFDPQLTDPDNGNLDYPAGSPAAAGSVNLTSVGSTRGTQLGARGLTPPSKRYSPVAGGAVIAFSSSGPAPATGTPKTTNVLDENDQTYWSTAYAPHTGSGGVGVNEFFTIDYGQSITFDHIMAWPLSHNQVYNPKRVRFEVSDDGATWTSLSQSPGIVGWAAGDTIVNNDSEQSYFKYELASPVTTRYLRYTMVDSFGAEYVVTSGIQPGLLAATATPPATQPTTWTFRGRRRRRVLVAGSYFDSGALFDDFAAGLLSSEYQNNPPGSAVVASGVVTLTPPTAGAVVSIDAFVQRALHRKRAVVKTTPSVGTANWSQTYLGIINRGDAAKWIGFRVSNNTLMLQSDYFTSQTFRAYNATTDKYLGIRAVGTTWYLGTSPDGLGWATIATLTGGPNSTLAQYTVQVGCGGATVDPATYDVLSLRLAL